MTLEEIVRERMAGLPVEDHDAAEGLPLAVVGFGAEEVIAAVEVLLSTRVTMGEQTRAFEAAWAARCGRKHGVMCNSGSSANLLMLAGLVETGALSPGDEVLLPAVAWSTSLFPIAQCGLVPVLADMHPTELRMGPAPITERTKAVLAVHLLGHPAPVDYPGLLVLEDACGAHGGAIGDRPMGGIGHAASFSFFFSHHITTIEGGMVVTDDDALADAMRSLRAHGWIRERSDRDALAAASPEIDPRFLFVSAGYNLRPTDLAGAFGLVQDLRLDAWAARRRANHAEWCRRLGGSVQVFPEPPGSRLAGFAFAMVADDREGLARVLREHRIDTRPISGSNLARQPAFARVPGARTAGPLPNADRLHEHGLFVGNSHAFGPAHADLLERAVRAWRDS
ncbi:MAG: DegT/DnrJ/EryC1/StrS family aminotransferase [Myxococcota bacterium]